MKQFHRIFLGAIVVLVAFTFSTVFATSEPEPEEGSTINNPFVISITGSTGANQTFHYTSFPFYFKTNTIGSFEVSLDVTKNEVTFTLVDTNKENVIALIEESRAVDENNKQLGVEYRSADGSMISTPLYQIDELLATSYLLTGELNESSAKRLGLLNIAPNASLLATRSNLFFFTNFADVNSQVRERYPDAYYTDLVYCFKGSSNSALGSGQTQAVGDMSIEAIITRLFLALGDHFLLGSMRRLFGNNISINTLIFNQFEMTKLDLYNSSATRCE